MNILVKRRLDLKIEKMNKMYAKLDELYESLSKLEVQLTKEEDDYASMVPLDAEQKYKVYSINYISEYQKVIK